MSLLDSTSLSSTHGHEPTRSSTHDHQPIRSSIHSVEPSLSSTDGIERLISERQLCELLGVGVPTIARWRAAGKGPRFVVLGVRRLAYRPSDVRAWLAERERTFGTCSLNNAT
jgi:predicted DNA-binding transcriptional regulator AlpA